MNRKLYPHDWEVIATEIKQAAGWRCEECCKVCWQQGEDWYDFIMRSEWTVTEAIAAVAHPIRYVLTVAHLNHCPEDCRPENLKALCAPCHCRYDLKQMGLKKRLKLERRGQLNLFNEVQGAS